MHLSKSSDSPRSSKKKFEAKLYWCSYRMSLNDTYYTVKYVYGGGWYVDEHFVTPMVEGLGAAMYEMAVNVLQIWLNARKKSGV
jgi:hypothetical protein